MKKRKCYNLINSYILLSFKLNESNCYCMIDDFFIYFKSVTGPLYYEMLSLFPFKGFKGKDSN